MNRQLLIDEITTTLDDAHRSRTLFSVVLIHVDRLAPIAEAHGIAVAEEVVAAVGQRIAAVKRGRDVLGRWAENTFGVVLKNCSPDDLVTAAERLLTGVRNDPIVTSKGPFNVTVTIGGITAPRHARTVDDTISRSEDALEQAKAAGPGSFRSYQPRGGREFVERRRRLSDHAR